MNLLETYPYLVSAIGTMVLILIVQLLIADVIGVLSKHLPGSSVAADHSSLLFRATRVVGNTNESIAIFILASIFCMLTSASPLAAGMSAWAYVASRLLYACCYYANLQTMRSVIFVVSLLSLIALLITGVRGWL